jgi:hypothetical protein
MITIKSGTSSTIVLRLNDNVTIVQPIYLFELESVQSRELFYFTAQDKSTTSRFNQFDILEITGTSYSASPTASTPRIQLTYGGVYNYKVYQKDNYILATSSVILDYGKALYQNGEYINYAFNA